MSELYNLLMEDNETICDKINFDEIKNKKILITGASGLVGLHLLSSLKQYRLKTNSYFEVYAVVYNKPENYLSELLDYSGSFLIQGDLCDIDFCNKLPNCDYIIHAATYGQPGKFMKNQQKTIWLNTTITNILLDKLNKDGKFLFISSSEVYSGSNKTPYTEDDIGTTTPTHPRSCYIEAKRCGEAICNVYRNNGVNVKIARLCLAYGTGIKKDDKRVMNVFIKKALNGDIDLLDDGSAIRTYCYITDVIEMMWNILFNGKELIYNIGGQSKISIRDLACFIANKLNTNVVLNNKNDNLIGSPNVVELNINKIINELSKDNFVDLNDGIEKVIKWIQNLK